MEVKDERFDPFHEEIVKIEPETMLISPSSEIKTEEHVGAPEGPDILAKLIKEEPEDEACILRSVLQSSLVNPSDLINIKREMSNYIVPKTELLTSDCTLPTLKSENVELFNEPCSSKDVQTQVEQCKKTKVKKVTRKKRKYPCPVCRKNCLSSKSRKKHFARHWGNNCITCYLCGKFFVNKNIFLLHSSNHFLKVESKMIIERVGPNSQSERNIPISSLTEFSKSPLLDQKKKQNDRESNTEIIGTFNSPNDLTNLESFDTGEKPFDCKICFKQFDHKYALNSHVKSHTMIKPFECQYCVESFNSKAKLTGHLNKKHLQNLPFKCPKCSAGLPTLKHLQEHCFIHIKRRIQCSFCSRAFINENGLRSHMIQHADEKVYTCEICFESFSLKHELDHHMKIHIFVCPLCSKEYKRMPTFEKHLVTHGDSLDPSVIKTYKVKKRENF